MARSSADDMELKRGCEAGILAKGDRDKAVMAMRVAKGRGVWGKAGKLASRHMAKPCVLAVTSQYPSRLSLHPCILLAWEKVPDRLPSSPIGPWMTMAQPSQSVQDQASLQGRGCPKRSKRLHLPLGIVCSCASSTYAIWAKENTTAKVTQMISKDGPVESVVLEAESHVTVEKDLVSQAEEEDTVALLSNYVMAIGEAEAFSERMKRELVALESANVYALMETESVVEEYEASLTGGSFDEGNMVKNIEACDWLTIAIKNLEASNIDPIYVKLRAFVDDACYQIEKYERNVRQIGVVPYIPRFSQLAARMEQYINGSRDLVDQAYTKIVTIMFVILEKIAQVEPKYVDIVLLENYAAFQHRQAIEQGLKRLEICSYDLANVVPTLAKYYHQASEAYEQACSRHINLVIYIIPFQVGMSKLDKTINAMYRKLQKNVTAEELLPSLWEKCKKEFLDKYATFLKLISKIYPDEKAMTRSKNPRRSGRPARKPGRERERGRDGGRLKEEGYSSGRRSSGREKVQRLVGGAALGGTVEKSGGGGREEIAAGRGIAMFYRGGVRLGGMYG
ncbi:hypothetical protein HU200_033516 [Digitaria exilis]|uniref:Exocyst complex component Sec3 C-terminal domain-containing protein n=1 Tax=Digitaria exilis TaxID=1010633 RepID=A0A835BL99_9POAL|nr:hypothetical protein HU200_033516 [Digitaria exilis]